MRSTCTAPTARKTPSASGSKAPLTQAPAARLRHHTRKRAVIRTVGTTPDPVRYLSAHQPPVPYVEMIGANIDAMRAGEDRERCREIVTGRGAEAPTSRICHDIDECLAVVMGPAPGGPAEGLGY